MIPEVNEEYTLYPKIVFAEEFYFLPRSQVDAPADVPIGTLRTDLT